VDGDLEAVMTLQADFVWLGTALALLAAGATWALQRSSRRGLRSLKQDVTRMSEDLLQMAELQMEIYRRVCRDLSDIEERVLDLSVPSAEAPPPLERRHQVLTLARKGVSLEEIARRLHIPKGEAELILNLRKYIDTKTPPEAARAAPKAYAPASS
jgi:DNA-binding NarL/FixJ family response regulator